MSPLTKDVSFTSQEDGTLTTQRSSRSTLSRGPKSAWWLYFSNKCQIWRRFAPLAATALETAFQSAEEYCLLSMNELIFEVSMELMALRPMKSDTFTIPVLRISDEPGCGVGWYTEHPLRRIWEPLASKACKILESDCLAGKEYSIVPTTSGSSIVNHKAMVQVNEYGHYRRIQRTVSKVTWEIFDEEELGWSPLQENVALELERAKQDGISHARLRGPPAFRADLDSMTIRFADGSTFPLRRGPTPNVPTPSNEPINVPIQAIKEAAKTLITILQNPMTSRHHRLSLHLFGEKELKGSFTDRRHKKNVEFDCEFLPVPSKSQTYYKSETNEISENETNEENVVLSTSFGFKRKHRVAPEESMIDTQPLARSMPQKPMRAFRQQLFDSNNQDSTLPRHYFDNEDEWKELASTSNEMTYRGNTPTRQTIHRKGNLLKNIIQESNGDSMSGRSKGITSRGKRIVTQDDQNSQELTKKLSSRKSSLASITQEDLKPKESKLKKATNLISMLRRWGSDASQSTEAVIRRIPTHYDCTNSSIVGESTLLRSFAETRAIMDSIMRSRSDEIMESSSIPSTPRTPSTPIEANANWDSLTPTAQEHLPNLSWLEPPQMGSFTSSATLTSQEEDTPKESESPKLDNHIQAEKLPIVDAPMLSHTKNQNPKPAKKTTKPTTSNLNNSISKTKKTHRDVPQSSGSERTERKPTTRRALSLQPSSSKRKSTPAMPPTRTRIEPTLHLVEGLD